MKTFNFEIPSYLVSVSATVTVEAETLEEAKAKILAGNFDVDADGEATVPSDRWLDVLAEMNEYPESVDVEEVEVEVEVPFSGLPPTGGIDPAGHRNG